MRLILCLVAVLMFSMATLLFAADSPGGVSPIQTDPAPSIIRVPVVVEVTAVGIVAEPVRSIIKSIEDRNLARKTAQGLVTKKRVRSLVKRVLKLPRSLRRR